MSNKSLLNRWLGRKKPPQESPEAVAPALTGPPTYPTTYGQQRLWTLCQLFPDDPYYHSAEAYSVRGTLDPDALRESYQGIIRRHETLRTVFFVEDGVPRQRVLEQLPTEFILHDGRAAPEFAHDQLLRETIRRPFDLERGPLSRLLLLQHGPESFTVLVVFHHLISDEASLANFREALGTGYGASGEPVPLALQYGAVAVSQRARDLAPSLAYWREHLRDAPATSTLPEDLRRPGRPTHSGALLTAELGRELTDRIHQRCRESGTTPFVYLLAAYYALLEAYTGQAELVVGTPVSNRDRREYEPLIGFFNETVLLLQGVDTGAGFGALLEEVRANFLESLSHKDTPFEAIVKELNPERVPGVNPVFQTMFLNPEDPRPPAFGPEIASEMLPLDPGTAKFDLTLSVVEAKDGFRATAEYATDLYGPAKIRRLLTHYWRLLEQVTADPAAPLALLRLPSAEEWDQQGEGNVPETVPVTHLFLDEGIGRQARESPQATAVFADGTPLTFAALEQRASALAAALRRRGASSGSIVGLHTRRGPDLVAGIYGILKSGAAYLPLDPAYPAERRQFMLEDSGARWVVADTAIADLPLLPGVEVLQFDQLATGGEADFPQVAGRSPEDPAYLIYTSGSTGTPKGVVVRHRNLAHSTAARDLVYGKSPASFLLLSSFSFDSSVAGIFWTLAGGGKLVIAPERAEQDMSGLSRLIHDQAVSHTLLLPTLYGSLLEYGDPDGLTSLDTVIVAGEACSPATVRTHFAALPTVRLFNEYGPTEATVWSTVHRITEADAEGSVPIGKAVPYTRIYLVDSLNRLVPTGVPGELCVGGEGLAEGYWDRPELTAARFSELTLPDGRRVRVYRTGDLARFREDGSLLFLGRSDRQVKLRGYRVEPDEVRSVLLAQPGVREAEVTVDVARNRLLAFVAIEAGRTTDALRAALEQQLPGYMVPVLHAVGVIPRLPNGKVDGQSLAAVAASAVTVTDTQPEPPTSSTEASLLAIWREALGQEEIGITDNFFSLGGDSILSIQIVARARRAGLELPPTAIFDRQTVRELARVAVPIGAMVAGDSVVYHGPVPLTPIQAWFFGEHRTAPHHWNHAWRFELIAPADPARIRQVARELYDGNEALRQRFVRDGDRWTATIAEVGGADCFEAHPLAGDGIPEFLDRFQAGLDLNNGPLFRVFLFGPRPGEQPVLVLFAHHLVIDMVSWQEIIAAFVAALAPPIAIGAPPAVLLFPGEAYHRWAEQLKAWAGGDRFLSEVAFWAAQQATPLLAHQEELLPVSQETIRVSERTIDAETTRALLQQANVAYGTRPEELLLAAVLLAVSATTGRAEHCLNLERHGREPLESGLAVQETIGWFTVAYPLTFRVGKGVGDTVVAVKETLRAVPNNGIGYGVLRYLAGRPELTQSPALYFNYLGQRGSLGEGPLAEAEFLEHGLRHPRGEFNRVWEVNAVVVEQQLRLYWSYSLDLHNAEMIAGLLAGAERTLREIVVHCGDKNERTFTPSDFPEADLSDADLEGLLGELSW